jgi:UMF1 family MFS transporter
VALGARRLRGGERGGERQLGRATTRCCRISPAREDPRPGSSAGYAIGYLGGGRGAGAGAAGDLKPEWVGLGALAARDASWPTRIAFVGTAAWWAFFTIPLLRHVPEPPVAVGPPASAGAGAIIGDAFRGIAATVRALRRMPHAWRFLVAFVIYNDAISTIIRMAAVYGTELGLGQTSLIGAILLVQFVGIRSPSPSGGWPTASARSGRSSARSSCTGSSRGGVRTAHGARLLDPRLPRRDRAGRRAGAQPLASTRRSCRPRAREFFGLFSVFNRFGGMMGPLAMAAITTATGSSRLGS